MVQQVATTKLDIAAPPGLLDTDAKANDGGGDAFSLQLADAQSGHESSVVRNDNIQKPNASEPASVQAPQEDDSFITDDNTANEVADESAEQDVDPDLLRFLQQLNQNNGGYDPTDTSGKKQYGGVLQNLGGESLEANQRTLSDASEEALVNINDSIDVDALIPINVSQNESTQNTAEDETNIQFANLSANSDLTLSEEAQSNEELVAFSSLTQPEENQDAEDSLNERNLFSDSFEEQLGEGEEANQFESLTLHEPLTQSPTSQNKEGELLSASSLSNENNLAEQDTENNDTTVNEALVQNLLQSSPEQQENAFNQISAIAGLNAAEKASKDFVAGLKAGFEDIKARYQAGQDVSNDLVQLVDQVTESLQENGQLSEQQLNQLTQAVGQFSQAYASQGEGAFQSLLARAENRAGVASTSIEQLEANKTAQQNSSLDRAINLAKPEAAVQLAEKVAFAANARNLVADIRLDPADLGGIQARVSLQGDQATVNFVTQSQQARDLLEQQTPKLRELLDEQGIELGQSSVQQESQQTQDGESRGTFASRHANGQSIGSQGNESEAPLEEIGESSITNGHVGAIDYFV